MRLARTAAGALVGVAVLAGCSSERPANETLPSAAPTSAEASQTLPPLGPPDFPMPPEAREQTPAGAEAFLRYYLDVYNLAQAKLDSTYMNQLSQSCQTCDRLSANIDEDARNSRMYEGGAVDVVSLTTPSVEGDKAEIAFSMKQDALTVRDSDGAILSELSAPQASLQCGAVLTWSPQATSWILSQWDVA